MKKPEDVMEILEAYGLTGSFRAAASLVGCDHKTVAYWVRQRDEAGGMPLVEREQRVANDLGHGAVGALGDLQQAPVGPTATVLADRLREDVRGRVRPGVDDLGARVLVLALAGERDREDLAMGSLSEQVDARIFHRQL